MNPNLRRVLLAVANKLHCVVSSKSGGLVSFVDARDVVKEIVINGESNSNGAILKSGHHGILARHILPALDLLVFLCRSIVAHFLACASVTTARGVLVALL